MTVDDEEPLTATTNSDNIINSEASGQSNNNNNDKLNNLLTSALHKHAAAKLAKKLTKSKKNSSSEDEAKVKKEKKDTKKKAKNKWKEEDEKGEEVELEVMSQVEKKRSRKKKKNEGGNQKDDELQTVLEVKEDEGEEGEEEERKEDKENENQEEECDVVEGSPTRQYLAAVSVPKKRSRTKSKGGVLGVTVHSADRFEGSPLLLPHPLVQVWMVECDTGQLVRKTSRECRATSYYESGRVDHILPIMTQPFHLANARSVVCKWEEELIFNEPMHRFTSIQNPIMVFFQLMEFPDTRHGGSAGQVGWLTFAWAFLKIRGGNDKMNVGEKLRLQLWRPRRSTGVSVVDLYSWWKSGNRLKYPSTLYVTLQQVIIPHCPPPALRSLLATQAEGSGGAVNMVQGSPASGSSGTNPPALREQEVVWGRQTNQQCQLPSQILMRIPPTTEGLMVVRFSRDGLRLACGGHGTIRIHRIPSGSLESSLTGHMGLIYDLCWHPNDPMLLLSASADATARIWSVGSKVKESPQILTHPAFVYAAIFLPCGHVVTGCYDHLVRIWARQKGTRVFSLVQELQGHQGFVTTLCVTQSGMQVLSGDNQGVIMVWAIDPDKKGRRRILKKERKEVLEETRGVPINALVPVPEGRRILVHSRDSQLRLICGRTWRVTQTLSGAVNVIQQLRGCVTPCGTWIMTGDEEGSLHAWHSDTGLPAPSLPNIFPGPLSCVDYHPFEHLAALAFCSPDTPVLLLGPQNTPSIPNPVAQSESDCIDMVTGTSLKGYSSLHRDIVSPVHSVHSHTLARTHLSLAKTVSHISQSHQFSTSRNNQSQINQSIVSQQLAQDTSQHLKSQGISQQSQGIFQQSQGIFQQSQGISQQSQGIFQQSQGIFQQSQGISQQSQGIILQQSQGISQQYQGNSQQSQDIPQPDHSHSSIFSEDLVRQDCGSTRSQHHKKDAVLRKLDAVLKMVTTDPPENSTRNSGRFSVMPNPSAINPRSPKSQWHNKNKTCGIIAVPSSSGDVSFISDPEVTPSKARARRRKVVQPPSS